MASAAQMPNTTARLPITVFGPDSHHTHSPTVASSIKTEQTKRRQYTVDRIELLGLS
eukprot:m.156070 g.156070  ORF g.156070 m.156070 type:complete len:57 (-) comp17552_c0_seq9:118-288(-)